MSEPTQSWDPARYARTARFVSELGAPLLELLAPRAGERILDLGCGDGDLTVKLAELGCKVVAVDASAAQVAAARARGLDARVADGQQLDFEGGFDGVFSNAALHWMRDPDAVIAGVWRALTPGGRFVGEMGGAGNVTLITAALVAALEARGLDGQAAHPWYFPTPEAYRASTVITQSSGYCVTKTILLAAVLRASGIPAAVGFADVKNHLTIIKTPRGINPGDIDIVG